MPDSTVMGEIVSIDNLHIAKVLSDSADAYTTDPASYFAPIAELKHDPKADATLGYYDGGAMFAYPFEGEAQEDITISGITEQLFAELTGKSYDPTTGIIYDNGDPTYSPYYALGYHIPVGNGYDKYRWFLKGLFVPSSEDYKTKEAKINPQNLQLTFKPLRTIHQWTIPDPRDGSKIITSSLKVMKADTSSPAFTTASSWFSQVQVPGNIGAPAALALSSSIPVDAATGVSASANQTLTFSNALTDYSGVSLLALADGSLVPSTVSVDTTGKIVTINPNANLATGAGYAILVSGVKDIYGQVLATQAINFTVA